MIKGKDGLPDQYWIENYDEMETIDGIGNSESHVNYLKSIFELEQVRISSVIDFGVGPGVLFSSILNFFSPFKSEAIEPSEYAQKYFLKNHGKDIEKYNVKFRPIDIVSWCKIQKKNSKVYDLGICTSVLQYLDEDELEYALPIIAQKVRYLYITFPIDKELKIQREKLKFYDQYAISRSAMFYKKIIEKSFTIVSGRLLESKHFYNEETTEFSDLFWRF